MRKLIYTILLLGFTAHSFCQKSFESISFSNKGIYNTFYDFMSSSPKEVDNFYVDSVLFIDGIWEGKYFKSPRYLDTKKRIKGIWGFSDGKKTYINGYDYFFEIFNDSTQLYYYGFGLQNLSNAGVGGGFIEGGIQGFMAYENSKRRKHKYLLEGSTGKVFQSKYYMDIYKSNIPISELIIYRISKGENIEPVLFLIDDVKYNFSPNSYLKLEIPYRYMPIIISFTDKAQKENKILVHLDDEQAVYIRCKSQAEKIEFIQVELETGEFESYKPKKIQKRRRKTGGYN
jgi:hypothetical protein